MFLKLLTIIVTIVLTACALLIMRQQRLETVHEMQMMHRQLLEQETTLWLLRSRISDHCQPQRVQEMLDRINEAWEPIPSSPDGNSVAQHDGEKEIEQPEV